MSESWTPERPSQDCPPITTPHRPIRLLIRHKLTKAFLGKNLAWTHDHREAADFPDHFHVREMTRELKLLEAELYYMCGYEPTQFDFAVPL